MGGRDDSWILKEFHLHVPTRMARKDGRNVGNGRINLHVQDSGENHKRASDIRRRMPVFSVPFSKAGVRVRM